MQGFVGRGYSAIRDTYSEPHILEQVDNPRRGNGKRRPGDSLHTGDHRSTHFLTSSPVRDGRGEHVSRLMSPCTSRDLVSNHLPHGGSVLGIVIVPCGSTFFRRAQTHEEGLCATDALSGVSSGFYEPTQVLAVGHQRRNTLTDQPPPNPLVLARHAGHSADGGSW